MDILSISSSLLYHSLLLKRLISFDEESENILKQQPEKKASEFVREAVKLKAKTLSTPEIEHPKTFRVKI